MLGKQYSKYCLYLLLKKEYETVIREGKVTEIRKM